MREKSISPHVSNLAGRNDATMTRMSAGQMTAEIMHLRLSRRTINNGGSALTVTALQLTEA
jgi:hypothetical protein